MHFSRLPALLNTSNITPATEIGQIMNACMLSDANPDLRDAVFADEATGFLNMRPATGPTEFVRAIGEAYHLSRSPGVGSFSGKQCLLNTLGSITHTKRTNFQKLLLCNRFDLPGNSRASFGCLKFRL